MGQLFILRSWVQQEYNGLLVNTLNRIFKSNLSLNNFKWLLTKVELWCVRNIIPRSSKRLWNGYPVAGASKSRPHWAADTRIGNVWEYHLPPPPGSEVISWENQWWHQKMSLNCSLFSHVNLPTILLLMIIRSLAYCSYHHTLYKTAFTLSA